MKQITDSLSLKAPLLFIKHESLRLHSVADFSVIRKFALLQCK